jgi:hypothetical protein
MRKVKVRPIWEAPAAGQVADFPRISVGRVLAHYDEEIGATGHVKRLASLP